MTEEEKKHQKELWRQDRIRARREEWQKIKKLGPGARLQYLWDYYKIVLVIAVVVIFLVYIVVNMIQGSRTETLLYTCLLNVNGMDPDSEQLQKDYTEARGGLEKMQKIVFDASVWVNPDSPGTSQRDVAAAMKIVSFTGAGVLDVFLAPPNVTEFEQESGMLLKLEEILTEEEIRTLGEAGYLYYQEEPETETLSGNMPESSQESAGDEDEKDPGTQTGELPGTKEAELNTHPSDGMHIYAVRIDQAGVIGAYNIYSEDGQVWFSVVGNSSRTKEAARFLRFLLGGEDIGTAHSESAG